jgi:hypothetical protein
VGNRLDERRDERPAVADEVFEVALVVAAEAELLADAGECVNVLRPGVNVIDLPVRHRDRHRDVRAVFLFARDVDAPLVVDELD